MTDSVSSFLLIAFSILDSFWLFFFIKWPENCFTVEISNNFTFFNQKDILIPILSIVLCKNIFVFWYSYMITDFKLWVFAIMLNTIIYIPDLTFTGFILSVLWYVLFCSSRLSFVVSSMYFNAIVMQPWFYWSIAKLTAIFCLVCDETDLKIFLKCIGNCNTFFVFHWNRSCIFAVNINNT